MKGVPAEVAGLLGYSKLQHGVKCSELEPCGPRNDFTVRSQSLPRSAFWPALRAESDGDDEKQPPAAEQRRE
eukprot:7119743-Alexandrium_andersonii.AAC.1